MYSQFLTSLGSCCCASAGFTTGFTEIIEASVGNTRIVAIKATIRNLDFLFKSPLLFVLVYLRGTNLWKYSSIDELLRNSTILKLSLDHLRMLPLSPAKVYVGSFVFTLANNMGEGVRLFELRYRSPPDICKNNIFCPAPPC